MTAKRRFLIAVVGTDTGYRHLRRLKDTVNILKR